MNVQKSIIFALVAIVVMGIVLRVAEGFEIDMEPRYDAILQRIDNKLDCVNVTLGRDDVTLIYTSTCIDEIEVIEDGSLAAVLVSNDLRSLDVSHYNWLEEETRLSHRPTWSSSIAYVPCENDSSALPEVPYCYSDVEEGTVLKTWSSTLSSSVAGPMVVHGTSVRAYTDAEQSGVVAMNVIRMVSIVVWGLFVLAVFLLYRNVVLKKKHSYVIIFALLLLGAVLFVINRALFWMA